MTAAEADVRTLMDAANLARTMAFADDRAEWHDLAERLCGLTARVIKGHVAIPPPDQWQRLISPAVVPPAAIHPRGSHQGDPADLLEPARGLDAVDPAVYAPTADAPAVGAVIVTEDDGEEPIDPTPLEAEADEPVSVARAGASRAKTESHSEGPMKCSKRRGTKAVWVVAERLSPFSIRRKQVPCGHCAGTGQEPPPKPEPKPQPTEAS